MSSASNSTYLFTVNASVKPGFSARKVRSLYIFCDCKFCKTTPAQWIFPGEGHTRAHYYFPRPLYMNFLPSLPHRYTVAHLCEDCYEKHCEPALKLLIQAALAMNKIPEYNSGGNK